MTIILLTVTNSTLGKLMNSDALIIEGKLNLVLETISKLLRINFKLNPVVSNFENAMHDEFRTNPKIIFLDKTALTGNPVEIIKKIQGKFKDIRILIVSLDVENELYNQFMNWEKIEIINLWNSGSILSILETALAKANKSNLVCA